MEGMFLLPVVVLWVFRLTETLDWWYFFAKVIAAAVASDKEKYNETFLGKQNEEYCAWILNPEKWGGIFA